MLFFRLKIIIFICIFFTTESFAQTMFEKKNSFILIKGGEFIFGNDEGEKNEKPQTSESIENFYINMYEISNEISFVNFFLFCIKPTLNNFLLFIYLQVIFFTVNNM